jgi:hypothetical protein
MNDYRVTLVRTQIQEHYQQASVWVQAKNQKEAEKIALAQAKGRKLEFITGDVCDLTAKHLRVVDISV